jgi:hypothetical protein
MRRGVVPLGPGGSGALHGRRGSRRRGGLLFARGRHDQRRRVLGSAEHGVQPQAAGAVSDRGQRLRDLGAHRGPNGRALDLQARERVPRPVHRRGGRLRPRGVARGPGPRDRILPGPEGSRAGSRARRPPLLALPVGRRGDVPVRRRARRGRRPGPAQASRGPAPGTEPCDTGGTRCARGERGRGGVRCRRGGAPRSAAPARVGHRLRLFARRGPHRPIVRHGECAQLHRRADDDGGPTERLHEGRDGARSAHPRLRRGRRGRLTAGTSRHGEGQGWGLQGDVGPAAALRRRPRLQLPAGRGEHPRPGGGPGHAGVQTGRRDPVLRLHLAGVHADPERTGADAVAVEQRVHLSGRDPRGVRRLSEGRRDLPLPDGCLALHAGAGAARRLPVHGARRERPAPHRDPLR